MNLRQRAAVFKALGHPARLAIVERLGQGECCVCELLEGTEYQRLSAPTVSQHLMVLKNAGVIDDQKRGKKVFYQLRMPCVAEISLCVRVTPALVVDDKPKVAGRVPSDANLEKMLQP